MYSRIRDHKTTRTLVCRKTGCRWRYRCGGVSALQDEYRDRLDRGEPVPKSALGMIGNEFTVDWSPYLNATWDEQADTTLSPAKVAELAGKITHIPPGLVLHGRVKRIMDERTAHGQCGNRHGLGLRRDDGLRRLARCRIRLPHCWPGQWAWHVLSTGMRCCTTRRIATNTFRCRR